MHASPYVKQEPSTELLRLRPLLDWLNQNWMPCCRDTIECWEKAGVIHPFRKHARAKAFYRKWEFEQMFRRVGVSEEIILIGQHSNREPTEDLLRRGDVATWLDVTVAEVDSWASYGVIHALRLRKADKALYRKSEIKRNILAPDSPSAIRKTTQKRGIRAKSGGFRTTGN
jgi:hypothetical protein